MKILNYIRRYLPTASEIQQIRYLHIFGDSLKHPELWHFTRQSTAKGVAIGLFCAFLPMPFEMAVAIFIACLMRGNLPLAIGGVWISNPITWLPLYTPPYLLGSRIIGIEAVALKDLTGLDVSMHYLALWLGCLIFGTVIALASHFTISLIWSGQIRQRWRNRREIRRDRKQAALRKEK